MVFWRRMRKAKRNRLSELSFLNGFLIDLLVDKLAGIGIAREDIRYLFPASADRKLANSLLGRKHAILVYLRVHYSAASISHFLSVCESDIYILQEKYGFIVGQTKLYKDEYKRVYKHLAKKKHGVLAEKTERGYAEYV